MTWAKLDDAILDNPKIVRAGPVGFALHVAAVTWCARNLTDGFVPEAKAKQLLSTTWSEPSADGERELSWELNASSGHCGRSGDEVIEGVISLLVAVELWHEDFDERGNFGYRLHDYGDYNPKRSEVLAMRAARQEAGKRGGKQSASTRQAKTEANAQANDNQNSTPVPVPVPVPNKPDTYVRDPVAPEPASGIHRASSVVSDSGSYETVVPIDLVAKMTASGVIGDLAKKYDASTDDVAHVIDEYVGFHSASQTKKRAWPHHARQRVAEQAKLGRLIGASKPPGLAAHEAATGKPDKGGRKWTPSAWDAQKNPIAWTDEAGKSTYKNPFQEAS